MAESKPKLDDFEDDAVTTTAPAGGQPVRVAMGTHSAASLGGFKDFCLKPELMNAITDNGFEQPSEVQHQALPQAMLGNDILAQAKAGMGKTAVFVFALLEQIEAQTPKHVQAIVVVNTRELAFQIDREFNRFNKYLPQCTTAVFFGGVLEEENFKVLADPDKLPAIVVGTPGRLVTLIQKKKLDLSHVKYFVVDEFDRCLEDLRMRRDVQLVFMATPPQKQVMMFSATMTKELHEVARRFMNNPTEVLVDQQSKLTLHGLAQYYMHLTEAQKIRKLCDLLDHIQFNQVIIFVNDISRCEALAHKLKELNFPAKAVHSGMEQADRLLVYEESKQQKTRIIVATDLFGRGIDIDRINAVVQFDMASDPNTYLHRVGRAGRFGTKGVTIAFVTDDERTIKRENRTYKDTEILKQVQERFEVEAKLLTDLNVIVPSQYMNQ